MQAEISRYPVHSDLAVWGLSGLFPGDTEVSRIAINRSPCTIGRSLDRDLVLHSKKVSKHHAELLTSEAIAIVRDVGSTNGTFVNGMRIYAPTPVGTRDLIQFADVELCLIRERAADVENLQPRNDTHLVHPNSRGESRRHPIEVVYQPVVHAHDESIYGFDAVARTQSSALNLPSALFDTVMGFGQEPSVSRQSREEAANQFAQSRIPGALFLNLDRQEELNQDLLLGLATLRATAGERMIVLQVPECSIQDRNQALTFASALRVLNIRLALFGFGLGHPRLIELTSLQPDFIKFDASLCRDLGVADDLQFNLVRNLHHAASELGIRTIADGLETSTAIEACRDIGFHLLEGSALGPAVLLNSTQRR